MEPDPGSAAGTLLAGRYEVGPLVGIGGTAEVYRAWDRDHSCPVAVKVFRPGAAASPGYGGGQELRVLAGLRHPGLVGIRGSGVGPQGRPFVVMDLVEGCSLSARLHDGPLSTAWVTRIGAVLADVLAVVHARGAVHRDVKPANVLLDAQGHPWLTDFGIARIVDATQVTATGVVVGTAAYMAPEQVRGAPVGPAADVYALGLVLLEAITGLREYDGNAIESALARLHRAPVVPAAVPDPLAAALRRMTAPEPAARPSAAEVAAVLDGRPRPERRTADTGRRRALAALACLVAGALGGGLALAGPGERDPSPAGAAEGVVVAAVAPPVPAAPAAAVAVPLVAPAAAAADAADAAGAATAAGRAAPRPRPVALANRAAAAVRPAAGRSGGGHGRDTGTKDRGSRSTADERRGDGTPSGGSAARGDHGSGKDKKDSKDKGKGGKSGKGDRKGDG